MNQMCICEHKTCPVKDNCSALSKGHVQRAVCVYVFAQMCECFSDCVCVSLCVCYVTADLTEN